MSPLSYQHVFEPGTNSAAPPLLLLHGTGGDEHDLLTTGRSLSPGSALLSPRGDVNEHGQLRFFRRLAEGVFDFADVDKCTRALAGFVAAAAVRYGFDAARLTAIGFSNGANIAASMLLLRPESLAAAVLLRPMVVLDPPQLPDLTGKHLFISSGAQDPIVPPDHPPRLAEIFRRAGASVTLHTYAAGHGLGPPDFAAARRWLDESRS